MNSRRKFIMKLSAAFAVSPFLSRNGFSCEAGSPFKPTPEYVYTPKNHLSNFYVGNLNKYLQLQYQDRWLWSKDIFVGPRSSHGYRYPILLANWKTASIKMTSNILYDNDLMYCSNIDLIYRHENNNNSGKDVIYFISSANISRNTKPYYATRFRMSSTYAKIYAALTFRDTRTDKLREIKISREPSYLRCPPCTPVAFSYKNAY